MIKKYLLSIIIPIYNTETTLIDAINSIYNQEEFYLDDDVQLIIVNDGSTDNSYNKLKIFHNIKNVIIIEKENGGLSSARNIGIEYCISNTNYISFLDSDDVVSPNYLSIIKSILKKDSDIDIVEFDFKRKFPDSMAFRDRNYKLGLSNNKNNMANLCLNECLRKQYWFAWSRVYKIDLFEKIKFVEGRRYEDAITVPILYLNAKKIYSSSSVLYVYNYSDFTITSKPKETDIQDILFSISEFEKYCESKDQVNIMRIKRLSSAIGLIARLNFDYGIICDFSTKTKIKKINIFFGILKLKIINEMKRIYFILLTKLNHG